MKQVKATVYELEGYAITVDVEGNIEEYAKNFLHIFLSFGCRCCSIRRSHTFPHHNRV